MVGDTVDWWPHQFAMINAPAWWPQTGIRDGQGGCGNSVWGQAEESEVGTGQCDR